MLSQKYNGWLTSIPPYSVRSCQLVHGSSNILFPVPVFTFFFSYEYLWEDGVKYKRPTKLPAPEYVDALMNWAQSLLDDESIFPNKIGECFFFFFFRLRKTADTDPPGVPFPRNFRETVKTVVRRLFRVYAHIYSNHFDHICALGIEGVCHSWPRWINNDWPVRLIAHLNTSYRHFFLFIHEVRFRYEWAIVKAKEGGI